MGGAVCIVSPGNLASNPRVLKEADALHEAGHAVTAVVCDYTEALRPFDDEIASRAPWRVVRVARPVGERQVGQAARVLARLVTSLGMPTPVPVAASAYGGPVAALRGRRARSRPIFTLRIMSPAWPPRPTSRAVAAPCWASMPRITMPAKARRST